MIKSLSKIKIDFYTALAVCLLFLITFTRLLTAIGIPSFFNFVHYIIVLLAVVLSIRNSHTKVSIKLFLGNLLFLGVVVISGILNGVGITNFLLGYLINIETFLLFYFLSQGKINGVVFKWSMLFIIATQIVFTYVQVFVFKFIDDDVRGVYLGMSQGAHTLGAFGLIAMLYVLDKKPFSMKWLNNLTAFLLFTLPLHADAKQVFLILVVAILIVFLSRVKEPIKVIIGILGLTVIVSIFLWIAYNFIGGFSAYMGKDFNFFEIAITQKVSVFGHIFDSYDSFFNFLFGTGPGHSISKFSQMIPTYENVLKPIGVTKDPLTAQIFKANQDHWISNSISGSSIFSLMFSWVGLFGDFGLFGLLIIIYILYVVNKYFIGDNIYKKFAFWFILILGIIANYWEEPVMMVFWVFYLMNGNDKKLKHAKS